MRKLLPNRYGDKNYLLTIGPIEFDEEELYFLEMYSKYYRTGFNEDGSIAFVDPSGGPFIDIGNESLLTGKVLREIISLGNVDGKSLFKLVFE